MSQRLPSRKVFSMAIASLLTGAMALPSVSIACTRTVYVGDDGTVITGRSMDWMQDMQTDLWAFPRGMTRSGNAGPGSPTWTSKYGSVIASGYNMATADGMNEKGLVTNLLYLTEADYGDDQNDPPLSVGIWAQYVLDNFATVSEAVDGLTEKSFRIVAPKLPNGSAATLHLSISDPTGDSAIFEYLDGKLTIHHGKQYTVMTNSPPYDQQLGLVAYWQQIGGMNFLPGTIHAADRFVRASFLLDAVTKEKSTNFIEDVPGQTYANQAVGQSISVMRGVSVPIGISTPGQPDIASTLWRTVADQKNLVYFFDSATMPNVFWVPLAEVDLSEGAKPMKLAVAGGHYYSGDAAAHFVEAKPFEFMNAAPSN
ncbi:linear amide C-N hydrolase [Tropicimonas sp. IMCC34043]|uniref:linear amide C-N hydrolase n=1 Tax=Tropicimonas sp. IMCC34043 TaxID=2248760 RepID=UPI001E47CA4D|nr:linear amide C-N hydrolase [Tropicimonas sp. IMCC34043]